MSSNRSQKVEISGISKLDFLNYPIMLLTDDNIIVDKFCYIIKHYHDGFSCLIERDTTNDNVTIRFGEWDASIIDLNKQHEKLAYITLFCNDYAMKFIEIMKYTSINKMMCYFYIGNNDELILCDIRISYNKFVGPGMLNDMFGKIIKTQEVIGINTISSDILDDIKCKNNGYNCDIILKPSCFKTTTYNEDIVPLYFTYAR